MEKLRPQCARLFVSIASCTVMIAAGAPAADARHTPPPGFSQIEQQVPKVTGPVVDDLSIDGVTVFGRSEILRWLRIEFGESLPAPPEELAAELRRRYHAEGFSYATVTATFDERTSRLTIVADEGRIDAIEFAGVDTRLSERFAGDFDIRVGDLFNKREIARAVRRLLARTHGSFDVARRAAADPASAKTADPDSITADAVHLVPRDGKRVLLVNLRKRARRIDVGLANEREDWYSPVDGFVPSLRFDATAFEHSQLNHTFIGGHISYKFAREDAGYSLGFERPFFAGPKLFVGAEVHELTASDDWWRISPVEQSLVALSFRNTYRDYYERRGYQAHTVLRATPFHEITVVFRDEKHDALTNAAEFAFFRRDHEFRSNAAALGGQLRALLVGYTWDSRSLVRDSVATTYRRHLLDSPFGTSGGAAPGWRLEWTSELSAPGAFDSDFDFTRHILNLRRYSRLTARQDVDVRLLFGSSTGMLPPQRLFALGGIGSIRGYGFKEAVGERMALVNVEFRTDLLPRRIATELLRGLLFVDTGRVFRPVAGSPSDWLTGIGGGFELGADVRVELGWRTDEGPDRMTALFRVRRTF